MSVHVKTGAIIDAPVAKVFKAISDPMLTPEWCARVTSAQWKTHPGRMQQGASLIFTTRVLGREMHLACKVAYYRLNQTLVLRSDNAPFDLETIYEVFTKTPDTTLLKRHTIIDSSHMADYASPLLARAIKIADGHDLERLRTLIEHEKSPSLSQPAQ